MKQGGPLNFNGRPVLFNCYVLLFLLKNTLNVCTVTPIKLFCRGCALATMFSISLPVSTFIDEDFFMESICDGYTLLWPVIRKLTTHATVA